MITLFYQRFEKRIDTGKYLKLDRMNSYILNTKDKYC